MKIVKPHKIKSSLVLDNEEMIARVLKDAKEMQKFCGVHDKMNYYAIAHSQVTATNPLRFFVTENEIIVNPDIKKHTRTTIDSFEGCASYPDTAGIVVDRYNKVLVEYSIYHEDAEHEEDKWELITEDCNGIRAKIFQHEIDHFDAIYIYEKRK